MKHVIASWVLVAAVGCGGKSTSSNSPSATAPAASATSPSAPSAAGPNDDCATQCMLNGPDDPTAKADWSGKSNEERQTECSAQCADSGMPVENEQTTK